MQRHTILINSAFSSTTQPTQVGFSGSGQSYLVNSNDYYTNNISGLNLGVVNPNNVRAYLNDPANENIINDFFSYLTGSTNQDQFREIFYSDQKLSFIFNDYYNQTVLNSQQTSVYSVNQQVTGTTSESYVHSNFNWDGYAPPKNPFTGVTQEINNSTRFSQVISFLNTFTDDESYYVPVFIKKHYKSVNTMSYDFDNLLVKLNVDVDPHDNTISIVEVDSTHVIKK